jgi:hypothetical protein
MECFLSGYSITSRAHGGRLWGRPRECSNRADGSSSPTWCSRPSLAVWRDVCSPGWTNLEEMALQSCLGESALELTYYDEDGRVLGAVMAWSAGVARRSPPSGSPRSLA